MKKHKLQTTIPAELTKTWYWDGCEVPCWLYRALCSREKGGQPVDRKNRYAKLENQEVQSWYLVAYGVESILAGGQLRDQKIVEFQNGACEYKLWHLTLPDGTKNSIWLQMQNLSVPGKTHIESVGPECHTVDEAQMFRCQFSTADVSDNGEHWNQQGDVMLLPDGGGPYQLWPDVMW